MPPDVGVVVVAAGRGERAGEGIPKQFRPLAGVPLLLHALRPFLSHRDVHSVVAVLPPDAAAKPPEWLAGLVGERLLTAPGGAERMDSVEAGLRVLPQPCQIVLVHDGARPFPDPAVINAVISAARKGTGAIAAVPVSDTLKAGSVGDSVSVSVGVSSGRAAVTATVTGTLSRANLWRAQTPQGFPRAMLQQAYHQARAARFSGTDESELVERAGGTVMLIPDTTRNLKVTTPDDFLLAEALARR